MEIFSKPKVYSSVLLGFDIGSVSVNYAVIDEDCNIIDTAYIRHKGQPVSAILKIFENISSKRLPHNILKIVVTGSGSALFSQLLDAEPVNEVIAQAKASSFLYPHIRTIIDIGGEDSKLIFLDWDDNLGMSVIQDFAMNSICAAGTGSFLDQQATRLGLSIEEFGHLALKSKIPPRIAGRCSVFAKSDMIHLQQEAAPDYDIVAGLCFAMARNFKGCIGRGKTFTAPISFQGGVAANKGMVRAFESILGLEPGELVIPEHFAAMGAIGACLLQLKDTVNERSKDKDGQTSINNNRDSKSAHGFIDINNIIVRLKDYFSRPSQIKNVLHPLNGSSPFGKKILDSLSSSHSQRHFILKHRKKTVAYLGIDVGSISTNLVAIDKDGHVLAKRYLMTAGRPIEAVRQGLDEIGREIGDRIDVLGVGTTGSGRYLIADYVGGDIVKNEITAQAKAAAAIDKSVDTIFEIGGQDSKYIHLKNGAITEFEMNKVCAAGTGSFLEEQAERLGINIKEEFGKIAIDAKTPISLGERCTVFMESDLVHHQQQGASKENLIAGLAYSIVYNYLNRVVGDKPVGQNIFFQGGVAFNKAVVAAFEKVVKRPVIVPPHHEVTGAIGVALITKEKKNWGKTRFKGFDLSCRPYGIESFECKGCSNVCQVRKVLVEGEEPLFYGSRCERFDIKKKQKETSHIPDIFEERQGHLTHEYYPPPENKTPKRMGIPRSLYFHELLPLFKVFCQQMGFDVILSEKTNKPLIDNGLQAIAAESCFPVKVAHGHLLDLINKKVDYIFLPSLISMPQDKTDERGLLNSNFNCPYVQTIPYTVKSAIDFKHHNVKILHPVIRLNKGEKHLTDILMKIGKGLGVKQAVVKRAIDKAIMAQKKYYEAISLRGREILSGIPSDGKAIVVVSRPYNGCDQGINLQIPKIFRDMGYLVIPMDYLPLNKVDLSEDWPNMYWRYGKRILAAAEFIRQDPRLFAVYITNFGCGPDSFIIKFFSKKMEGKPYLQMEIDEHSADAGAITRCEAFSDSLENLDNLIPIAKTKIKRVHLKDKKRQLFIPYMCDHAHALRAAFESTGIKARVMGESSEETQTWGRKYTSGKECYPCIITTGDMVKVVNDPDFDPENTAFFMPGGDGPCRFGQYNMFHRLVLDELGFPDVPIYSPTQGESFYKELGIAGDGFIRRAWQGFVSVDMIEKWVRHTRPYEVNPGESEKVYQEALLRICNATKLKNPMLPILKEICARFTDIKVDRSYQKPLIGIVGEIFVRANRFSNNHIIDAIEKLGGEAWLPPITEWLLYINYTSKIHSLQNRNYKNFLKISIKDIIQRKDEAKYANTFQDIIPYAHDPSIKTILRHSAPYLHESFEGEAILSIGKAIDFSKKGVCGIINVMPFTCMPGTISNAILKRVREEHGLFPFLNMAYDGLEQSNIQTRLEAFMFQSHQYMKRRHSSGKTINV